MQEESLRKVVHHTGIVQIPAPPIAAASRPFPAAAATPPAVVFTVWASAAPSGVRRSTPLPTRGTVPWAPVTSLWPVTTTTEQAVSQPAASGTDH